MLDLLQETSTVSLRPLYAGKIGDKALGAVLELQVHALERSSHKPESQSAIAHLINDLLDIYSTGGLHLRRARYAFFSHCRRLSLTSLLSLRTLLWRLRHIDDFLPAATLRDLMADILTLLASPVSLCQSHSNNVRFSDLII